MSILAITASMLTSCSEENVFLSEPVNDRDEVLSRASYDEQINIAMNWGWNGTNDNVYYLLGRRSNPDIDFNYYAPNWYAKGFRFSILDFISYDGYAE